MFNIENFNTGNVHGFEYRMSVIKFNTKYLDSYIKENELLLFK